MMGPSPLACKQSMSVVTSGQPGQHIQKVRLQICLSYLAEQADGIKLLLGGLEPWAAAPFTSTLA